MNRIVEFTKCVGERRDRRRRIVDKDKLHSEIVKYCGELRGKYGKRDEMQKGMEDMFLMRHTAHDVALEAISDDVVLTKSTDERVAIQAVLRLLTTTIEDVSCPMDENERIGNDVVDKVEALGGALLASNDKVSRKPLRFNTTLCASLYDEMHIQVVCTEDIVAAAEAPKFCVQHAEDKADCTAHALHVQRDESQERLSRLGHAGIAVLSQKFACSSRAVAGPLRDESG